MVGKGRETTRVADADPRTGPALEAEGLLLGSRVARRILDAVRRRPGATLRDVASDLDVSWGTVSYHGRRLERDGFLRSSTEGRRRVFHPGDAAEDAALAACHAMLQGQTMRRVAAAIQVDPGLDEAELARRLALPARALAYHVERLLGAGLVTSSAPTRREGLAPTPLLDLLLGEPPGHDERP